MEHADVVVIGMGPGGEDVAGRLAGAGLDVIGIERELLGGECPYWGCVPTKMMVRAADALAEARRVTALAGKASVAPDWSPVAARIRAEATDDWDDAVAVARFERKGGRFRRGTARLDGPNRVAVDDGTSIEARRGIVIATGTIAAVPPIPGLSEIDYWTNREAVAAEDLPSSLLVLGGGPIGLEFAQALARFEVEVTVVEALPRLLASEEPEVSELLTEVLRAEGLRVHTDAAVEGVARDGERIVLELAGGERLSGERLLVATGRRAELRSLAVGTVGIDEEASVIPVDGRLRAGDGLWAVGDVTGHGAFTHVALYQARIAAADILGEAPAPAEYRAVPRVTFTDPEVGSVGLTEAAAHASGMELRVAVAQIPKSARGRIHKEGNSGLIKLVEDADRGVLVGATSTGPAGGEVLGLLTLAVHAEVPTDELRRMIYAYPTFHRAVERAVRELTTL